MSGNDTRTLCWLLSVGWLGSHASVGSSTPSWPHTRPEFPLLNGAVPCQLVLTFPGVEGTVRSEAAIAGVDEPSATRPADAIAAATPPVSRRRWILCMRVPPRQWALGPWGEGTASLDVHTTTRT